jgi:leader peptidase (prepilin peptidase)/N-methyltransferase
MELAQSVLAVLFGLLVGSFLNVVIDRLPEGRSLLHPPSHCQACSTRLKAADLIPVVSYLALRGRCRYCQAKISLRSPLVELLTGTAFGLLFFFIGPSWELAVAIFYFCLLVVIFFIDLERELILNWLVYPAVVIALILSLFSEQISGSVLTIPSFGDALLGAGIGFVLFLVIALVSRGGMGMGDVKMAALMGAMLGYPVVLAAVFLAVIGGGLISVLLLVFKVKGRKEGIPFGPFLALGTLAALFWGRALIDWYLSFFT